MRKSQVALLILVVALLLPRLRHFFITGDHVDFGPYYVAAVLVRNHQGLSIYNGADTGRDPQNLLSAPDTVYGKTAQKCGVRRPFLYLYPPTLADLLAPLTFFPFAVAARIWSIFNYAILLLIAAMAISLAGIRWSTWGALIVLLSPFCYSPILQCIAMGQVSVLLLLLWTAGVFFYWKRWPAFAGFAFALATALKLTPLVVIVPFLVWRDWKVLRAMLMSLVAIAIGIVCINGPSSLPDYFLHVVPPMSRGALTTANYSITACVERLYGAIRHHAIWPEAALILPKALIIAAKSLAAAIVGSAMILTYRNRKHARFGDRPTTLALFGMLSACVAPVSWGHAYSLCFLALCLLWTEAVMTDLGAVATTILFASTVVLTTYVDKVGVYLAHKGEDLILASIILLLTPLAAAALVLGRLSLGSWFSARDKLDIDPGLLWLHRSSTGERVSYE